MELTNKNQLNEFLRIVLNTIVYLSSTYLFIVFIITIYEFINVRILKNIENYPWGKGDEEYWNYATPEIYSNNLLAEIILLILVFIISVWYRKRKIIIILTNIIFVILTTLYNQYKTETRYDDKGKLRTTMVLQNWGISATFEHDTSKKHLC